MKRLSALVVLAALPVLTLAACTNESEQRVKFDPLLDESDPKQR